MNKPEIRTVKIPLHNYLSTKEVELFHQIAGQCEECFLILRELARESGECCPITLYSQVLNNELEDLALLTPQIIIVIARKACRNVFGTRSKVKTLGKEIPINRCILKIVENRFMIFNLHPYKVCCKFDFPTNFTQKYKFHERDFLWGNIDVQNRELPLTLSYHVKEMKEEFPLFYSNQVRVTL